MDNTFRRWLAVGTAAKLYVYDSGADLSDITPTGFTAGRTNANPNIGYGNAVYGESTYGNPRPDLGIPEPATIWSFDLWGENLVGCTPDDGDLYMWDASTATPATAKAARIANSPQFTIATAVTSERIQMAFGGVPSGGAEADRDRRRVFWSDSEDNTDWTPTSTNQSGDHILDTEGDLLGAVKVRDRLLIFTTIDAHLATYVGLPYVYSFDRVGDACGPVSVNAVAVAGPTAYWMGRSAQGFFMYDGTLRSIPCDVESFLLTEMNQAQASKIVAWHNTLFNEVVWFYPSTTDEVDAYISYNYVEEHWATGTLGRTAVTSRGIFLQPILFDASGNPYEHEVGNTYADVGQAAKVPYVESGPIELGNGNRVLSATSLIPDVTSLGDITTTFFTRLYPTDNDTQHGPFTMTAPTSVRFTGRTCRMRCTSDSSAAWNVGVPRLELQPGGRR
tara:strand:- start:3047 stop:4390 length:1344 start_codon:yes stop_codon:yes gene_type:complete